MGIVRTIHGDVDPSTLGVVNAHDHLIRVGAGEVYIDPDHLLIDEDKAVQEATYFVEVYLEWRQSWVNQYTVAEIADLLIADIVEGVDANDYMGPLVKRTDIRAGCIKWATAYGRITDWEVKTGEAVAIASKETGAPINTHVTAGTCGPEQARFLIERGVAPEKIAIGHIQRNWDPWIQEQIVGLGAYARVNLRKVLGEKGYGRQILLGTDSGKASYQKVYGSVSGIDYDPAVFCPRLIDDEGFDPDYVQDLLVNNAAAFFAFEPLAG